MRRPPARRHACTYSAPFALTVARPSSTLAGPINTPRFGSTSRLGRLVTDLNDASSVVGSSTRFREKLLGTKGTCRSDARRPHP